MTGRRHVANLILPMSAKQAAQMLMGLEGTFPGAILKSDLDGFEIWAPVTAGVAVIDLDGDDSGEEAEP
jgi:hypothetical protein